MIARRSLLAGLASATIWRRDGARASDVDVVIVGAGAAGIGAARELRRLGRGVVVLEARSRVGGRAFTDTSLGEPFDAGAAILHAYEKNPWANFAEEYGVAITAEPDSGGFRVVLGDGREPGEEVRARRREAFAALNRLLEGRPADAADLSFTELAQAGPPELLAAAAGVSILSLGEEPERVSVRDWQSLWTEEDRYAPGGFGALVARATEGLPIRTGQSVTAIDWSGQGVEIASTAGNLRARAAIVTSSIGLLQGGGIRFTPDLPAATRDAIGGLGMGALTKLALRFDGERFGLEPHSDIFDVPGPRAQMNAEAWAYDRNLVVCLLGGDHARELCRAGEQAAIDYALGRLAISLGPQVHEHFIAGKLAAWTTDPLALGGYSIARPGHAGARARLAQPIGERIWLAGEASGGGGAMTAGGALLSGQAAAREIAAAQAKN